MAIVSAKVKTRVISHAARATACLHTAMLCLLIGSGPTFAGQAGVGFSGNVAMGNTCVIIVDSDGEFVPNADATLLSSRLPGGRPGTATVYSLLNHSLSVDTPGNFANPANAGSGTSFSAYFSGRSILLGRSFGERPGSSPVRLRRGISITEISVDLEAANAGGFEEGDYSAQAVIRCE
jgi:hypothetical protein